MFSKNLENAAKKLLDASRKQKIMLATAESCTGGLIAALFTSIPGSSDAFERGFVTYSDTAKKEMLGVSAALIKRHGAVSAQVAKAMAEGALAASQARIAVSVTGIAGPGGGTQAKPVGLVYIGVACKGKKAAVNQHLFKGSRDSVRLASVKAALAAMLAHVSKESQKP